MAREQKTILVTGGAGFLGSNLCDLLIAKGNKVICVDNLITGRKQNVQHLLKNRNFTFIKHDITAPLKLNSKIDEIYNLASPASPVDFDRLSEEILLVNSLGTKNMLDLALKNKARFFEASTSEVYGSALKIPQDESYWGNVNSIGPRSCYDESKRFSEALVMAYYRKYSLDTRIVRIFNTYGPKMRADDGRVVTNFINQALHNKPITIYGSGQQTRSFCYVSDEIDGIWRLMQANYNLPVNIGNPNEFTILELAQKIKELANSKSEIIFKPLPKDDPERRKPDIALAKKLFNWHPKVELEEGLKRTIEYFREQK
ncbi:MAG: SDR family oxidoreductase [Candidatus Diapherotrites archaeon]|nr:SDR family oxidoreductase [Candidatus Diapherotrites archaeon]